MQQQQEEHFFSGSDAIGQLHWTGALWTVIDDYRNATKSVRSPQPSDTDRDVLQGHVVTRQDGAALNWKRLSLD